jgi:cytochrome P450
MLGQIAEMFGGIPRMALVVVVLLALIGGVWYWKRGRAAAPAASKVDRETENVKAERAASQYADMIAKRLPERRDEDDMEDDDMEDDDMENAVTDEYVKTVGADQEISGEDDEEYEPMDAAA